MQSHLTCVCIEGLGAAARSIATNGHVLAYHEEPLGSGDKISAGEWQVLLSNAAVNWLSASLPKIPRSKKKKRNRPEPRNKPAVPPPVIVSMEQAHGQVTLSIEEPWSGHEVAARFRQVNESFPPYRRVVTDVPNQPSFASMFSISSKYQALAGRLFDATSASAGDAGMLPILIVPGRTPLDPVMMKRGRTVVCVMPMRGPSSWNEESAEAAE